ncbi:MAG: TetR/AcrR family transcriptional regulator [Syntrophales bacterium]
MEKFCRYAPPSFDGIKAWNKVMATPLEKARKDPDSMKARILAVARKMFGEYGYHGTTTRMIALEVGIDISTLHYHWGEKKDLFESVVIDINKDLGQKLMEVEKIVHGATIGERLEISIDQMTEYLFEHPEVSNLILWRYFGKTRDEDVFELQVPEFTAEIAWAMGMSNNRKKPPSLAHMMVLAIMNSIHNFVSGENFFRTILKLERGKYIALVKETLKIIHIPAFTMGEGGNGTASAKGSTPFNKK